MDWKSVAQLVAPFAPTVGRFLGDLVPFPGASIVGGLLGEAVAAALGVPATPEAVGAAIQGMPPGEVQARLAAAESEAVARYDAMARIAEAEAKDRTEQGRSINETMREEAAKGVSWWHWRHLLGYVMVLLGFEMCILVPLVLTGKITASDVGNILTAMSPVLLTFAGLLGYVAQDTTKRQTVAMTGEHPPPLASGLAKAVLPVKKK